MREFKDEEGRPWRLALTVSAALRVRDMVTVTVDELSADGEPTGVKMSKPLDLIDISSISQTLQVVRNQYATVGEVLYAILVAQVEERKLTRDQFLDALRGDSLDAAVVALEQEIVDFFPLRLRKMVGLLAAKMAEVTSELLDRAEAGLATVTADQVSGAASGKPPEFLAPIQETGRSDSLSRHETQNLSTNGGTQPT